MLGLADETWLALVGMVLSFLWNCVQSFQRRSSKADADDALLALGRVVASQSNEPLDIEYLHDQAVKATNRPGAERALDKSMRVVISESQRMQAFGKKPKGY